MVSTQCQVCGGTISREGNFLKCRHCGHVWMIDVADDVHAVDRANAWAALRDGDFERATALFEELLLRDPKSHEAYWGHALAQNGIVYVVDLNENKKVPTCNNITEQSFVKNKDVSRAIELAPDEIALSYQMQSAYIERVRVEWLQKASKEPPYDVFISFKDSDRENGIERTQDSIDAQDLYNALVADGYQVFFSRVSLRGKVSEQYEPYIYNAIKTAKVMIVFGEKPEYFSAVWLKNEWSRFKARLEKGEKHKNSLITVYKNMNPADLPTVLKSRQCMNAADLTFYSDLRGHIKRVIEEVQAGQSEQAQNGQSGANGSGGNPPASTPENDERLLELMQQRDRERRDRIKKRAKRISMICAIVLAIGGFLTGAFFAGREIYYINTTVTYVEGKTCSSRVRQVFIPNDVTEIGEGAFNYRSQLKTVTFEEGSKLTSIGRSAFYGCSALTSITIPESVTSIGSQAFRECSGLREINLHARALEKGEYAFDYVGQATEGVTVNIGAEVTVIPHALFYFSSSDDKAQSKIVSVNFAEGGKLTSIGSSAFYGCSALTSITIPESVTSIDSYAFSECSGLREINYNARALEEGEYAFNYVGQATDGVTVNIGAEVTAIPDYLFSFSSADKKEQSKIVRVNFAEDCKLTSIGVYAFSGCSALTSITILESVTSIGTAAFSGCSALTSITIPESVTSIGGSAFSGCTGLTSVTFEVTTGWKVGGANSVTDLADASTAAEHLTSTYCGYDWTRD